MRNAKDLEELESWPDEEPPPRACPECGDDDRHMPDCSRNYRNRARPDYDPKTEWPERYSNGLPI
jgi:hypothetical protein